MPAGIRNRGYLDPERCWKEWCIHSGSLESTRQKFFQEGITHPRTGEAPTKSGIEKAAFTWAIQNQDEARGDLEYAWSKVGEILTDDRWDKFILDAAKLVYHQRPGKHEKFLQENALKEYT